VRHHHGRCRRCAIAPLSPFLSYAMATELVRMLAKYRSAQHTQPTLLWLRLPRCRLLLHGFNSRSPV
jgi:hypothetical protein